MRRVLLVLAAVAVAATAVVTGAGATAFKPYGEWTYVQALSIEGGETYASSAYGTLRLNKSGAFADRRGIANFAPTNTGGKFKLVGNKLFFYAIKKGKRDPKHDAVYTFVFNKKLLALSIVSKLKDGSKLAFLLYLKGSEDLPRCGGRNPSISLKC